MQISGKQQPSDDQTKVEISKKLAEYANIIQFPILLSPCCFESD